MFVPIFGVLVVRDLALVWARGFNAHLLRFVREGMKLSNSHFEFEHMFGSHILHLYTMNYLYKF